VRICYFPFDLSFSTASFFDCFKPECVLLTETELWPNLILEARRRGTPVGVINARLSEKSAGRYGKFKALFSGIFSSLDFVLAQTGDDAKRFAEQGVSPERIHVLGNMKFDSIDQGEEGEDALGKLREEWKLGKSDFVLLAGSTHANEEERLGRHYLRLKKERPELKMVIAPRHIERSQRLLKWFLNRKIRSVLATNLAISLSRTRVLLPFR